MLVTQEHVAKAKAPHHEVKSKPPVGRSKRRIKVANRYQWKCYWCSQGLRPEVGYQNSATIEHLTPRSQGGANHLDNLAAACYRCNYKRGTQNAEVFALCARDLGPDRRAVDLAVLQYRRERGPKPCNVRYQHDRQAARQAHASGDTSMIQHNARAMRMYEGLVAKLGPPPQQRPLTTTLSMWQRVKGWLLSWC